MVGTRGAAIAAAAMDAALVASEASDNQNSESQGWSPGDDESTTLVDQLEDLPDEIAEQLGEDELHE